MKKNELIKLYAIAQTLWPSFKIPDTELESRVHDEVWFKILENYNIELITKCMFEYALKSEFCNIGQIARLCKQEIKRLELEKLYCNHNQLSSLFDNLDDEELDKKLGINQQKQLNSSE